MMKLSLVPALLAWLSAGQQSEIDCQSKGCNAPQGHVMLQTRNGLKVRVQAANSLVKLEPPSGMAWRGSTLQDSVSPEAWEEHYGQKLHIYRYFSSPWTPVPQQVKDFSKSGGIVWFNMKNSKHSWNDMANADAKGTEQAHRKAYYIIKDWIKKVKTFAPAKVYGIPWHEPDLYIDDENGFAAEDYRNMHATMRRLFAEAGVDNVVWGIDYSNQKRKEYWRWKALWPGADQIDWVFFNAFQDHCFGTGYTDWNDSVGSKYRALEEMSSETCDNGKMCNFTTAIWGIGAHGPGTLMNAVPAHNLNNPDVVCEKAPMDTGRLVEYFQQATQGMETDFSRLRAYIFFNAFNSIVDPLPGAGLSEEPMWQAEEEKESGRSGRIKRAFQRHLGGPLFVEADDAYFGGSLNRATVEGWTTEEKACASSCPAVPVPPVLPSDTDPCKGSCKGGPNSFCWGGKRKKCSGCASCKVPTDWGTCMSESCEGCNVCWSR